MRLMKKYYLPMILLLLFSNLICLMVIYFKQNRNSDIKDIGINIFPKASAGAYTDKGLRESPVVLTAKEVSPSIVSVGAKVKGYVKAVNPQMRDFFFPFIAPYQLYQYEEKVPFLGSGIIIDKEGYILTNYHVVEDKEEVFITLMDGREINGTVLDADRIVDIALIKIKEKELPAIKLGNSDEALIGETVLAIGNPFGNFIEDPRPTVTCGVISALHRNFNYNESGRVYQDMIQTDAAINPGNSGGALVNINGELIGINTFIVSKSGASNGIGFAIPINRAKAVANEIITYGKIRSLWLDFDFTNLTRDLAKVLNTKSLEGALITNIQKGGPADKAGLKPGDIILKLNKNNVKNSDDLRNYFVTRQVGDRITFELMREGKTSTLEYVIEEYKNNK